MMSMLAFASPLASASTFADLAFGEANVDAIEFLRETGVVGGYEDGTFRPGNAINRAELTKILVEGLGFMPDEEEYSDCFLDVTFGAWYVPYVCFAAESGWVEGYEDGNFRPAQTVNRVEAIKMTVNVLGLYSEEDTCDAELFDDADATAWYAPYLCEALELGLLEENADGTYSPAGDMTRGAISENLYRAILVEQLGAEAFDEEVEAQVDSAKESFVAERQAIGEEIDAFRDSLAAMREAGATDEEIAEARDAFWDETHVSLRDNRENFVGEIRDARSQFRDNASELREEVAACHEMDMRFDFRDGECKEKPERDGERPEGDRAEGDRPERGEEGRRPGALLGGLLGGDGEVDVEDEMIEEDDEDALPNFTFGDFGRTDEGVPFVTIVNNGLGDAGDGVSPMQIDFSVEASSEEFAGSVLDTYSLDDVGVMDDHAYLSSGGMSIYYADDYSELEGYETFEFCMDTDEDIDEVDETDNCSGELFIAF